MGQSIGTLRRPMNLRVFLTDYPHLINDTYTVERTNGTTESGWRIPANSLLDSSIREPTASIHLYYKEGFWRIFMDNSKDKGGWRRINSIWPTRLNDAHAIEQWRKETIVILDMLKDERIRPV